MDFTEIKKVKAQKYNYPTKYLLSIYRRNRRVLVNCFSYNDIESNDKDYVFLLDSLNELSKVLSTRENIITDKKIRRLNRIVKLQRNRNKGR